MVCDCIIHIATCTCKGHIIEFLFQGDVLTVLKDKDANWFEVSVEDRVGIVPKSYVEIVELDIQ